MFYCESCDLAMVKQQYPCNVLLADSGYDCKGKEIAPIRKGGCYKSLERINLLSGLYGKRWMVVTVFSVIKRRFGDRIKSRSSHLKFVENNLISTAYNIWRFFIPTYIPYLLHNSPYPIQLFLTEQDRIIKSTFLKRFSEKVYSAKLRWNYVRKCHEILQKQINCCLLFILKNT